MCIFSLQQLVSDKSRVFFDDVVTLHELAPRSEIWPFAQGLLSKNAVLFVALE
jgi:hypothetical protein